jgi:hypothetical protein
MAFWRLWTQDMASGRYDKLTASTEYGTAIYTVDGDPSTVWYLNATSGLWECRTGVMWTIRGLGVSNHNWAGRSCSFLDSTLGTSFVERVTFTPATNADFVVPFSTPFTNAYHRVSIGVGSDDAYAGIVSLLVDCDESGTGEGNGYGILTLGDEGGVRDPIGRALVPSVGVVQSFGGLELTQDMSEPFDVLNLDVTAMRAAAGLEWYRVRKSFQGSNATLPNPSWSKGIWVTGDEAVDDVANEAWYCHPTGGLEDPATRGRVNTTISLRTRSRGL